ncbi:MAG: hypothetical protein ACXV8M_03710 [Candidatus Angelobacter sp.]
MKTIAVNLFDLLFGCWHRKLSFPRSVKRGQSRPPAAFLTGTYVICLNCGKEFAYDWDEMRVVEQNHTVRAHDAVEAESRS